MFGNAHFKSSIVKSVCVRLRVSVWQQNAVTNAVLLYCFECLVAGWRTAVASLSTASRMEMNRDGTKVDGKWALVAPPPPP